MMEERYHATAQNQFYPDMSNANKNITVEAKLISPPTYLHHWSNKKLRWDYKFKKTTKFMTVSRKP